MIKILHVSFEYLKGVGGIKTVTNGLLPALSLSQSGLDISIVTPHFAFFDENCIGSAQICVIRHTYKGVMHSSNVTKISRINDDDSIITHYLIKPVAASPVKNIFAIEDEKEIYQAFKFSEMNNRREYFNSAVAAFVRLSEPNIPSFDIVQLHSWQTGIAACLIKEFANIRPGEILNKIPHILTTIHMLSEHAQGATKEVGQLVRSLGLPDGFADHFADNSDLISAQHIKQIALGLLYADCVNTVSKGLARDLVSGKSFGLDRIFENLHDKGRLVGITNGITVNNWDPSCINNLGEFSYKAVEIVKKRQSIKNHLASMYNNLDPSKIWLLYVGRFSEEKGIDMLESALEATKSLGCNLIIMGIHVTSDLQNLVHQQIDQLKLDHSTLVIDNAYEQQMFGKQIRAASDFTIVPSHIEACGLVPMEALTCGSIPITSDVQGICDVVTPLQNNVVSGTGFVYSDNPASRSNNFKQAIFEAVESLKLWQKESKIDEILARLMSESGKYDWSQKPAQCYIELYQRMLQQNVLTFDQVRSNKTSANQLAVLSISEPNSNTQYQSKTNVLHVAMEYGAATFGGLGVVATQMVSAQNGYMSAALNFISAGIITPYYRKIFDDASRLKHLVDIEHMYNGNIVITKIFSSTYQGAQHYMAAAQGKYANIFDMEAISTIYNDTISLFVERVKYLNSAAAAFAHNYFEKIDREAPTILILHDWHAALTQKILHDRYRESLIQSIFIAHVSNIDYGGYQSHELQGIGLNFAPGIQILKAIGLSSSNKIVAVSPCFLKECMTSRHDDIILENLRKLFVIYATRDNKVASILNGFSYNKFCPIGRFINDMNTITISKQLQKQAVAEILTKKSKSWTIDTTLPVILFVGRFSAEKGIGTFNQVINIVKGKAIFFALGRGVTESLYETINKHSLKTDNIFISYNEDDQNMFGAMMRACADFTFVPSHREACGLVPMEGFANGSLCITSGVGGLRDSVTQIDTNNDKYSQGNGFIYKDQPDEVDNIDMQNEIHKALIFWSKRSEVQKNTIQSRLIQEAKSFDWLAPGGSIAKYSELIDQVVEKQKKASREKLKL